MDAIVVGAGFAGMEIWLPILNSTDHFNVVGVVDPLESKQQKAKFLIPGIWTVRDVQDIPDNISRDTVVFVVTPDHFSIIVELAVLGFKNLVVEKPLVSRDVEVRFIQEAIATHDLRVY